MNDPIIVQVDKEIESLMDNYISNLHSNCETLLTALAGNDFDKVKTLGHNWKGSGGGYGLWQVTEIGKKIEEKAKASEGPAIQVLVDELKDFLKRLKIEFV